MTLSRENLEESLNKLNNIKRISTEGLKASLISPFFYYAFYSNLLGFFITLLVMYFIENDLSINFKFHPSLIPSFFMCFVITIFLYLKKYPSTWSEYIDNLLSTYSPVNEDAYNNLQLVTKEIGFLDLNNVLVWVKEEEGMIIKNKNILQSKPLGFLKK